MKSDDGKKYRSYLKPQRSIILPRFVKASRDERPKKPISAYALKSDDGEKPNPNQDKLIVYIRVTPSET